MVLFVGLEPTLYKIKIDPKSTTSAIPPKEPLLKCL